MPVDSVLYTNEYATFWAAVGAIAQGAASLLGLIALIYSIMAFRRSFKSMHYAELDRMYFDLLRIAVEKPHLRTPPLSSVARQGDYDSYAFMVWNFLETVHDRCQEEPALLKTWHPIIETERRLHRDWFALPENQEKFKEKFRVFVQRLAGKDPLLQGDSAIVSVHEIRRDVVP